MPAIALRAVDDSDLDDLFRMMNDPEAIRMAAFTREDPADRAKFDAHQRRLRTDPEIIHRAIVCDGALAGTIASFVMEGETEITYWLDRPFWGHGIATEALKLFLTVVPVRPLHARVASDNTGSRRVLAKAGFREVGTEISYAVGRGAEIEETVLILE
jgi:RimJ/RimL family protein N-acetyltransferase